MKLSFSSIFIALSATGYVRGQTSADGATGGSPVKIEVNCGGIDAVKLDSISETIMRQVLEESYESSLDFGITDSFVKVSEDESWRCGNLCSDDDKIDPRKKAKKRRPPPSLEANTMDLEEMTEEASDIDDGSMHFDGFWNCGVLLCPDNKMDYAKFFAMGGVNTVGNIRGNNKAVSINMSHWEKTFVHSLIDTRRDDFRAIKECKITMTTDVAN